MISYGQGFVLSNSSWFVKNVIMFSPDVSSSVHIDNRRNDILILGKGRRTLNFSARYTIRFSEQQKKICNGKNSYLFANAVEI